jgi:4'-phosphopantetheinyl transferase
VTDLGWLTRSLADVPADDGWLAPREREVLAGLRVPKRRADWRLGRWTAKAAVAAWLEVPAAAVAILAAADGAPAAWLGPAPAPVALSLSHRAGRGLAVVGGAGCAVGCDLELVEPRSDAFVALWLAPGEQAMVSAVEAAERPRLVNVVWTAKEAAAKVRREGLRLDVRSAVTHLGGGNGDTAGWRPLTVDWEAEGRRTRGWWRAEPGWVMAIAGDPAPAAPRDLGRR